MSGKRELVLRAPIGRALWSLSWPLAAANELMMLHLSILIFWLDRLLGESGLAVESLLRPVQMMVVWLFASAGNGASVLIGRSVGARDGRAISIAAGAATLIGTAWLVLVLIAAPLSPVIARAVAGDLPVADGVLRFFLPWLLLSFPIVCAAELLLDVAAAAGWTRMGLTRVIRDLAAIAVLLPIAVDSFGFGIAGVPLTIGVCTAPLVVVLAWAVYRRRLELGLGQLRASAWRPAWPRWKEILKIGLPMSISRVVTFAVQIGLVQFAARSGAAHAVGYGIAVVLVLYGANLTFALSNGARVIMAQSLGAAMPHRARSALRGGLVGAALLVTGFVLATMADTWIIGLFTTDPDIAGHSERALSIMRWGLYGLATWQVLLASFAALGLSGRASALTMGAEIAGLIFALLWPGDAPLETVALAFCVASGLKALLLLALARRSGLLAPTTGAQLAP
jgi:Na+-driven multidrug efflux pump